MKGDHAAGAADLSPQPLAAEVLREKYLQREESGVDDLRRRVALALAEAEPVGQRGRWAARFLQAQRRGFLPAGRVLAAAGTADPATWVSCFVLPLPSAAGLERALAEAATTLRLGGGVGLDFSGLHADPGAGGRGDRDGAGGGVGAGSGIGPVQALQRFDAQALALDAGGRRRGAQMGVLRCDHPDLLDFIQAKDAGGLTTFNLSVAVTDGFMHAVDADAGFAFGGRIGPARPVWQALLRSNAAHAGPGVLFIDTINRDNALAYCETLSATNPCAEQPLPPYGACCLGSVDLTRFVRDPFAAGADLDLRAFARVCAQAVRMLDDVLELTPWPLPQQRAESRAKRRIGLGFTGLADALVMLGLHYGSEPARTMARTIAQTLRDAAFGASITLARERGPFPALDVARFLEGGFAARLPPALRDGIRRHGLRHSHLLAIAPAGSISLALADNVSNGIEPAFGWQFTRRRRLGGAGPGGGGETVAHAVEDHAWRLYRRLRGPEQPPGAAFVTALEVDPADQVAMVAAVAPFIDGAISKTVSMPAGCTADRYHAVYRQAWMGGVKGLATWSPRATPGAVLSARAP